MFSFQQSVPSVAGLDALCSLGLIQQDFTLVTAVLQELDKLGDDPAYSHHTDFLHAMCHALQVHTCNLSAWADPGGFMGFK